MKKPLPATFAEWKKTGELEKIAQRRGWELLFYGDSTVFRVSIKARDRHVYHLRCDWSNYPNAPSVLFCTELLDIDLPAAWPQGSQQLYEYVKPPPSKFLCCPFTQEGITHHPNWLSDSGGVWVQGISSVIDSLIFVENELLNGRHYGTAA